MGHTLAGWATARAMRLWERMTEERGQGTVEYIGMVIMVALFGAGVAVAAKTGWGEVIGDKLKDGLLGAIKHLIGGLAGK